MPAIVAPTLPAAHRRVAVVDDDESIRKSLERLLRAAGLEVQTYASGADFLADVREFQPHCVLIDLHMPCKDGFEVHESLASQGLAIPVIVVTGQDNPEYRARARELGVAAYLCKPVRGSILLDAILAAEARPPQA
jgi:FixJ family two-component response regulator